MKYFSQWMLPNLYLLAIHVKISLLSYFNFLLNLNSPVNVGISFCRVYPCKFTSWLVTYFSLSNLTEYWNTNHNKRTVRCVNKAQSKRLKTNNFFDFIDADGKHIKVLWLLLFSFLSFSSFVFLSRNWNSVFDNLFFHLSSQSKWNVNLRYWHGVITC